MLHTVRHPEVFSSSKALVRVQNSLHKGDLPAHGHDFAEIVIVRDGAARHKTTTGSTNIQPGTVVTLGPDSWHAYENRTHLKLSVLYLSSALLDHIIPLRSERGVLGEVSAQGQVTARTLTPTAFTALITLTDKYGSSPSGTTFAQLGFFYQVLDCLTNVQPHAHFSSTVLRTPGTLRNDTEDSCYGDLVTEAIQLLRGGLDEEWNVDRLAARLALSPGHLSRIFRREVGHPPMAFLNQLRAERMARIIRSGTTTIAAAGRAVGWPDPAYATRRFVSHWGTTPTAYRNRSAQVQN
nr:AraC family transcriptional regulator [Arthrobacter sp. IN13]